jgi:hypothetical protein
MAKKTKGRPDAKTTRKMQFDMNRRMTDALLQSAGASAGIREGMEYGRFPGTAGDQMQTEKEDRTNRRASGGKMETDMAKRPMPRPSRAPASSKKPTPRPAGLSERRDLRKAADSAAAAMRGSALEEQDYQDFVVNRKAGGKVKKMAMGGKCRGMGKATKGGSYSRG